MLRGHKREPQQPDLTAKKTYSVQRRTAQMHARPIHLRPETFGMHYIPFNSRSRCCLSCNCSEEFESVEGSPIWYSGSECAKQFTKMHKNSMCMS